MMFALGTRLFVVCGTGRMRNRQPHPMVGIIISVAGNFQSNLNLSSSGRLGSCGQNQLVDFGYLCEIGSLNGMQ